MSSGRCTDMTPVVWVRCWAVPQAARAPTTHVPGGGAGLWLGAQAAHSTRERMRPTPKRERELVDMSR